MCHWQIYKFREVMSIHLIHQRRDLFLRVWTLENSFGFGGSSLHARRLGQAVHSWLWELRLGHSESFDFPALLRAAAAEGHDTSGLMALIEETLARWRKNRA